MDVYGLMHVNKEKAWEETLMSLDLNMLLLMQKKKKEQSFPDLFSWENVQAAPLCID